MDDEKYIEIAKNYLSNKTREKYYEILVEDEQYGEWRFLYNFNDDEVSALLKLRDKYGKDDYVKHLDEVYDDPDEIHDLSYGCEIQSINLDQPCHQYTFARHDLVGDRLEKQSCQVELCDDDYICLLEHALFDRGMNINKLKYIDQKLYRHITFQIDCTLCDDTSYTGKYPYLITMDEINDDVQKIKAQNPGLKSFSNVGYLIK